MARLAPDVLLLRQEQGCGCVGTSIMKYRELVGLVCGPPPAHHAAVPGAGVRPAAAFVTSHDRFELRLHAHAHIHRPSICRSPPVFATGCAPCCVAPPLQHVLACTQNTALKHVLSGLHFSRFGSPVKSMVQRRAVAKAKAAADDAAARPDTSGAAGDGRIGAAAGVAAAAEQIGVEAAAAAAAGSARIIPLGDRRDLMVSLVSTGLSIVAGFRDEPIFLLMFHLVSSWPVMARDQCLRGNSPTMVHVSHNAEMEVHHFNLGKCWRATARVRCWQATQTGTGFG